MYHPTYWRPLVGLLALFLTACQTAPIVAQPPASLLMDCPETYLALKTNGDIAAKVLLLRKDLEQCNNDKAALRLWHKE